MDSSRMFPSTVPSFHNLHSMVQGSSDGENKLHVSLTPNPHAYVILGGHDANS